VRININMSAAPRARHPQGWRVVALACFGLALAGGALGGCAGRLPEPNAADAVRAAQVWPGTTVGDLHRGKEQYVQRCSGCHGLIDPRRVEAARWPGFVKEMSGRLKLSGDEVGDLTRYLVVASQSPRTP